MLAQLSAKKGNLDIPLAYVVQKPAPPSTYEDETECLVYEAKCTGPGWEQDKKTVGNCIIGLLAQSNAKTWINTHLMSQDGSAMMASLWTHFLGTAQVECIVQYACTKRDKATFRSQAIILLNASVLTYRKPSPFLPNMMSPFQKLNKFGCCVRK